MLGLLILAFPTLLRPLYISLIRSKLTYCSLLWRPNQINHPTGNSADKVYTCIRRFYSRLWIFCLSWWSWNFLTSPFFVNSFKTKPKFCNSSTDLFGQASIIPSCKTFLITNSGTPPPLMFLFLSVFISHFFTCSCPYLPHSSSLSWPYLKLWGLYFRCCCLNYCMKLWLQ